MRRRKQDNLDFRIQHLQRAGGRFPTGSCTDRALFLATTGSARVFVRQFKRRSADGKSAWNTRVDKYDSATTEAGKLCCNRLTDLKMRQEQDPEDTGSTARHRHADGVQFLPLEDRTTRDFPAPAKRREVVHLGSATKEPAATERIAAKPALSLGMPVSEKFNGLQKDQLGVFGAFGETAFIAAQKVNSNGVRVSNLPGRQYVSGAHGLHTQLQDAGSTSRHHHRWEPRPEWDLHRSVGGEDGFVHQVKLPSLVVPDLGNMFSVMEAMEAGLDALFHKQNPRLGTSKFVLRLTQGATDRYSFSIIYKDDHVEDIEQVDDRVKDYATEAFKVSPAGGGHDHQTTSGATWC